MTGASEAREEKDPIFDDALFRVRKKNGTWKEVEAPVFDGIALADGHTHLQYMADPVMALARAGLNGISYMCTVLDVFEDDEEIFGNIMPWCHQAAVKMQRIVGRGC